MKVDSRFDGLLMRPDEDGIQLSAYLEIFRRHQEAGKGCAAKRMLISEASNLNGEMIHDSIEDVA